MLQRRKFMNTKSIQIIDGFKTPASHLKLLTNQKRNRFLKLEFK
jgi:hypothetical protein